MKDLIKVALIDDHQLFRRGLGALFEEVEPSIKIILSANNGKDMIDKLTALKKDSFPDVFIIDVEMPVMNGIEATEWLIKNYPTSKVIILTMHSEEDFVLHLIKRGVKSYLLKDNGIEEIVQAVLTVVKDGYYFPQLALRAMVQSIRKSNELSIIDSLTEKERKMVGFLCREMTHVEIAKELGVSLRTVDNYKDSIFKKLNVKTVSALVLFAVKNNLVR